MGWQALFAALNTAILLEGRVGSLVEASSGKESWPASSSTSRTRSAVLVRTELVKWWSLLCKLCANPGLLCLINGLMEGENACFWENRQLRDTRSTDNLEVCI